MTLPSDAPRVFATPPGVTLGPLSQIADGKARAFVVQMRAGRFHGFCLRQGEQVYGYVDRCPHMGVPLTQMLDNYLTLSGEMIACAWHGALFGVRDGACVGGPCAGQALTPWPVTVNDRLLVTA